jgi:SAM-dependent methyltransferase
VRPVFALLVIAVVMACAEAPETQAPTRKPDVGYVPTRQEVVDGMLELAGVKAGDVVYDLGSGDGRFVIGAAQRGARGVGIDIDPKMVQQARENVARNGVGDRVKIIHQDMFLADVSEASVVTLYLLPELNRRLRPKLWKELKPGSRVVSNMFGMGDWKPDREVKIGNTTTAFLWTIPPDAAERAAAEEAAARKK